MLITFKLVKNSLKFFTCFTIITLLYNYEILFTAGPQKRTLIQRLQRESNISEDTGTETKILPNMKYILIWNEDHTFEFLESGQTVFIENKCSFTNCYITMQRNMIPNDYTKFHAIIFNGKKVAKVLDRYMKLPKKRLPHQIYVFAMQGDCITHPVCAEQFDDYFNLTWTYKLNSDVNWSLFKVLTLEDSTVVAPMVNANWTPLFRDNNVFYQIQDQILDKEIFGVWISSNCESQSPREVLVKEIQNESKKFDNILHIVDECGAQACPFATRKECLKIYQKSNFYLAFEVVLAEDYMSSELLDAFDNYCVPVVYGGADYSRFLPPLSYIDARKLGGVETAKHMSYLIHNLATFFEYYEWRKSFKIVRNIGHAACDLCEALNKHDHKEYKRFRQWWNPDFENTCKSKRSNHDRLTSPDAKNVVKLTKEVLEKEVKINYVIYPPM